MKKRGNMSYNSYITVNLNKKYSEYTKISRLLNKLLNCPFNIGVSEKKLNRNPKYIDNDYNLIPIDNSTNIKTFDFNNNYFNFIKELTIVKELYFNKKYDLDVFFIEDTKSETVAIKFA